MSERAGVGVGDEWGARIMATDIYIMAAQISRVHYASNFRSGNVQVIDIFFSSS